MIDWVYHRPQHAGEVDDLLHAHGSDAKILAGGTDLLVQARKAPTSRHIVDLVDLVELSDVDPSAAGLRIGANAPMWKLTENPVVRSRFAGLVDSTRCVGSVQIQNRATIVGNICNASPAADTGPPLLIYDTVVGIRSLAGRRQVPLARFWVGPRQTVLGADEWVEYVDLTDAGHHGSCYVKLGRTRGVDLALVGAAVLATADEIRLAYASVAPTVLRALDTEQALDPARGVDQRWSDVERSLSAEIDPIDDLRASARYRSAMALVCTQRALTIACRRLEVGERTDV